MPKMRDEIEKRLHNYGLYLKWLEFNSKKINQIAYKLFVEETGLTV